VHVALSVGGWAGQLLFEYQMPRAQTKRLVPLASQTE
jgi:hypothetical protein